jgi:peptidoglycan/xylan/chitin deacetylase (PgdA/CDA1 family)
MLRSIAKTCLACAYTWSGVARRKAARRTASREGAFITCYHRVVENFDHSRRGSIPSMLISTAMLERHIDWLAKRFTFASLDDIGSCLESGRSFMKPLTAITFDDGYSDVYHHAYPLLKRKGIPAAVFVVTGVIGTGRPQIFDRFYLLLRLLYIHGAPLAQTMVDAMRAQGYETTALQRLPGSDNEPFRVMTAVLNAFPQEQIEVVLAALEEHVYVRRDQFEQIAPLTWEMIETMHRNGVTIGSHTMSHRLLTSETLDTARAELLGSKLMLEQRLQSPVHHFAYPDGRFNAGVVRAVESAGYRWGYAICRTGDHNLPLLTIPRKVLWERSCLNMLGSFSPAVMNCQVDWVFDRRGRCEHDHATMCEVRKNGTVG